MAASALATATLLAPGIANAGIVVASSGPSAAQFPRGKKLPDTSKITLKKGDTVTILDGRGTKVLRGAGTFSVGAPSGPSKRTAFAALTRQRSSTRVRTGAVRAGGTDGKPRSPNLWYVDVTQSGTMCILDPTAVRLWRPAMEAAERYSLQANDGSSKAVVNFGTGAMLASWNVAEAPVADGSAYRIGKVGSAQPGTVTFAVMAEQPDDPEALGEALLQRGCENQFELLTQTLAPAR